MNQRQGVFPRIARQRRALDVAAAFGAGLLATVVGVWSLELWRWTPGTPLGLTGDSTFVAMQLKDIATHGWYWFNQDLAFPYGQNGALFPELNVLHVAVVKLIGVFVSDPFSPGVIYFVMGYALAAIAMYALCRSQGVSVVPAVAVGVLFSCAPGHQERFGQLWLAAYWVLPLGVWVVLEVMRPFPSSPARTHYAVWPPARRIALMAVCLVIVGLSGVYYVAFILILLLCAALARRWVGGRASDWLPPLAAMAFLAAVALAPLIAARVGASRSEATGEGATTRSFAESELFAGKLMDLVLPWPGHRVDALATLTQAYNAIGRPTAEVAALGIAGTVGCSGLVFLMFRRMLSTSGGATRPDSWALLAAVCFLFYTVGGLGAFIALFATPQVRTWSRMSILILLFGLLFLGWLLSRDSLRQRPKVLVALSLVVLVVGVLDQTNPERSPTYEQITARLAATSAYTTALERAVGGGCAVFQLPVVPFPESAGSGQMNGYDQLIPYLTSPDLKWSSGAIRGTREADWQLAVDGKEVATYVRELSAAGFCAVEVDTQGFDTATDPRQRLDAVLGPPIAKSADGVFVAYRLPKEPREPVESGAAERRLLEPVLVSLDAYRIRREGNQARQWVGPEVVLRIVNLSGSAQRVSVSMRATAAGFTARQLTVEQGDVMLARALLVPSKATPLSFMVSAPPGVTRLRVSTSGEPNTIDNPRLTVAADVSDLTASIEGSVRTASLQQQVLGGLVLQ